MRPRRDGKGSHAFRRGTHLAYELSNDSGLSASLAWRASEQIKPT